MLSLCLLISADLRFVTTLQVGLKGHGIRLYGASDFATARPVLEQWQFDVVLCDADCSEAAATDDTVRALSRTQRAPVVVLATPGGDDGPIAALEAGAMALIDRSASPRLIALKVQRLMDLTAGAGEREPRAVWLGELKLDPRRAKAVFRDRPLPLTGGEFELLLLLAARSDGFVHRRTLLRTLGRTGTGGEPRRSADMHVCRLRRKLREAGASSLELETVYGKGYALRLRGDPVGEAAY